MIYINESNKYVLRDVYNDINIVIPFLNERTVGSNLGTLSLIYIYNIKSEETYIVNFQHNDLHKSNVSNISFPNSYVYEQHLINSGYDLELYYWWVTESSMDIKTTSNLDFYKRYKNFSYNFVPLANIIDYCNSIVSKFLGVYDSNIDMDLYKQYNDYVYKIFKLIESPGCNLDTTHFKVMSKIRKPRIKSNYKLYTTTGRPSNTRDGVNLAGLNKTDGTRSMIIADTNSFLLEFDYSAFHIRLISNLIKYTLPTGNLHIYLGRQYFNTLELTDEQYNESKAMSFRVVYGSVPTEFEHLKFFKKLKLYREALYDEYLKNGFVRSVIFNRPIGLNKNLPENKLFNYLLQSYETEYNAVIINQLFNYLLNKQSYIALYTYDSFLLNVNMEEKHIIKNLKDIIYQDNMSGTIEYGLNYGNMKRYNK